MSESEKVVIAIIEDKDVPVDRLKLPDSVGVFDFVWHESFQVRIESTDSVKQRESFTAYEQWLSGQEIGVTGFEWSKLGTNKAVLFFDFGLGVDSDWFEQGPGGVDRNVLVKEWVGEDNFHNLVEGGASRQQGVYLVGLALQNMSWEGTIVIATGQLGYDWTQDAVKALKEYFTNREEGGKRVFITFSNSLVAGRGTRGSNEDRLKRVQGNFDKGIDAFIEKFGPEQPEFHVPPLEERLWPEQTGKWFNGDEFVPHDPPSQEDVHALNSCQQRVRAYIEQLLTYSPPEDWFTDYTEYKILHKELNHFVGAYCFSHTGDSPDNRGRREFTLGCAVLLLAAAGKDKSKHWVDNFRWAKERSKQIVPAQSRDHGRSTILALGRLFEKLSVHKKDGSTPLVRRVNQSGSKVQIWLGFDCSQPDAGEEFSFLKKCQDIKTPANILHSGNTFDSFLEFISASAAGLKSRECRNVINLKVDRSENPPQTILEIVAC